MHVIAFFLFALLLIGIAMVATGVGIIFNKFTTDVVRKIRFFLGLALACVGAGVIAGWFNLVMWLIENLK